MDVILNRRVAPSTAVSGGGDAVCRDQLYVPEDEASDADYQFRAVILFLPLNGVVYCRRDCHAGDAGLQGMLKAYDVSWLRVHRRELERYLPSYTFGEDGFVWRFYSDKKLPCSSRQVSAWRISTGQLLSDQQPGTVGVLGGRAKERTGICPCSLWTSSAEWTIGVFLPTIAPTNSVTS